MTYNEYKKFLEKKYIDINGTILDHDAIRDQRTGLKESTDEIESVTSTSSPNAQVCITLTEGYDQSTADRLLSMGLVVEQEMDNEIIGNIPAESIPKLQGDKDVLDVVVVPDGEA